MTQQNQYTKQNDDIIKDELLRLQQRRQQAAQDDSNIEEDNLALAFSGGGIRSATFNIGFMQALEKAGVLKFVDYLSTVSGGGYTGTSYTWFGTSKEKEFPFGTGRDQHNQLGGKILCWIRGHGSPLTPGKGLNFWALIAALFTGTLINLLVMLPIFMTLFYFLSYEFTIELKQLNLTWLPILQGLKINSTFDAIYYFGLLSLLSFPVLILFYALSSVFSGLRRYKPERSMRILIGRILMFACLALFFGSIPQQWSFLAETFEEYLVAGFPALSLSGVVAIVGGLKGRSNGNESKGLRAFLLSFGLILVIYGMTLYFYHITEPDSPNTLMPIWLTVLLGFSITLATFANINLASMHRFYRNRLLETYFPTAIIGEKIEQADTSFLKDIPANDKPYHIVNTNIKLVGSSNPKYKERGGDNFILTPLFCGSDATGYVDTANFDHGEMDQATAMAISGAAVSPNTYLTPSRPLNFIMALFNIDLGFWARNPKNGKPWIKALSRPRWFYYMFRSLLGRGLDEQANYIQLSDGGHFDNLALYELIRRRCKFIIVTDAGADPDLTFSDLGRIISLVRVDFGCEIYGDISPIKKDQESGMSDKAFVHLKISYHDGSEGQIIYVKPVMLKGLSEDINAYQRANSSFPDTPTSDQFFDEREFESYRELGFQIGNRFCQNLPKIDSLNREDLQQLFTVYQEKIMSSNSLQNPEVIKKRLSF